MIIGLRFVGSEEPDLRNKIQSNQTLITSLEGKVQSVESVADRLETAKQINDKSVTFSSLIPKIGAVLPDGVILNSLTLTGGSTDPLQLEIDLTNASVAPVMIKNLVESGLFEAADIASLTPKGESDSESTASNYKFTASITASFKGTAEAKRKAKAADEAKAKAAEAAQASNGNKGSN